jgi:CDP-glucose 4,6-dehydratase
VGRRLGAVEGVEVIDAAFWRGRRVLLTGHTGFKGGWLALWLRELGARVTGYALEPPTDPSFFESCGVAQVVDDVRADIRDVERMKAAAAKCDPQVVFHLAARSIVRAGYADPLETYGTNVMGTATVLEACRGAKALEAIVCVTTDKCYENREWEWPYREDDRLGGRDPYSSSKAAAELVAEAWRRSFFADGKVGLATARAGNVIGGGDWAADRLIPDLARAVQAGSPSVIRNPSATRPWQHVLEPLSGYLVLAQRLAQDPARHSEAWNFGPDPGGDREVGFVVDEVARLFGSRLVTKRENASGPHEAGKLMLDSSKARARLAWRPRLALADALRLTVEWYDKFISGERSMRAFSEQQIKQYASA